ncbi:hypothetical protein BJ508DRAFT_330784 [Ascobolus immersus RN42]|uniref:Uncharacterized protein n=1 Tax=Ascobolus immersus RN42 TaxID=1160509 RepID=A0A3N4HXW8_ASCIM|nr:hypothetical protein BJ508DRAFT_330784 [Ascobolus immersus RN42]
MSDTNLKRRKYRRKKPLRVVFCRKGKSRMEVKPSRLQRDPDDPLVIFSNTFANSSKYMHLRAISNPSFGEILCRGLVSEKVSPPILGKLPLTPGFRLLRLLPTLPLDKKLSRSLEVLLSALASPDYLKELQKILKLHKELVWEMYDLSRLKGFARPRSLDAPALRALGIFDIPILALLIVEGTSSILENLALHGEEYSIVRDTIFKEVWLGGAQYVRKFGARLPGGSFLLKLERGMARQVHIDLIATVTECLMGDINFLLFHCEDVAFGEDGEVVPYNRPGLPFLGRNVPLLKFLVKLRSESIESRIWRHLREADDEPVLVITPPLSYRRNHVDRETLSFRYSE